jgi:hypothetical protein
MMHLFLCGSGSFYLKTLSFLLRQVSNAQNSEPGETLYWFDQKETLGEGYWAPPKTALGNVMISLFIAIRFKNSTFFLLRMQKPSKDSAIASFVLGLLCVIPWLNIGISILAMYFGFRSIYNIRKYPDRYAGMGYAVAGATLGVAWFIGTFFFLYRRYLLS